MFETVDEKALYFFLLYLICNYSKSLKEVLMVIAISSYISAVVMNGTAYVLKANKHTNFC